MFEVNKIETEYGQNLEYFCQFLPKEKIKEASEIYGIKEVKSYKNVNRITFTSTDSDPIFEFGLSPKFKKMYRPNQNEPFKRHSWQIERPKGLDAIFGYKQLPEKAIAIIISDSYLDAFLINSKINPESKIFAVGLDGSNSSITLSIIEELQKKSSNLILMFRSDKNSANRAILISKRFGLKNFTFLDEVVGRGGKTFADYLRLFTDHNKLKIELGKIISQKSPECSKKNDEIQSLLDIEEELNYYSENEIVFPPPLLSIGDIGVIYANAINLIQGKMGVFKSTFSANLLIKILNELFIFLGMKSEFEDPITCIYIDTERSIKTELAKAIKYIKENIGDKNLPRFRYTSLKKPKRVDKLTYLKSFINEVRKNTIGHIFLVIDVVTDVIKNSNDLAETYELIDSLGNLTEDFDATILAVIHENPGSEKARGHLGTEFGNKASSLISIGFEKNGKGEDSEIVKIKFLKNRNNKKPSPIYCKYSEITKKLELLSDAELKTLQNAKKEKALIDDVVDEIQLQFDENQIVSQKEIVDNLIVKFSISKGTAISRIKEIINEKLSFIDKYGIECNLIEQSSSGKETTYILKPIISFDDSETFLEQV
jgi:KaiC/GvpD/RAD55 family RecA-like ATPase